MIDPKKKRDGDETEIPKKNRTSLMSGSPLQWRQFYGIQRGSLFSVLRLSLSSLSLSLSLSFVSPLLSSSQDKGWPDFDSLLVLISLCLSPSLSPSLSLFPTHLFR
jgi:hypothetical protein